MADKVDIDKLAFLARIKLDSREKEKLQNEFEAILTYVSKLKEIDAIGDSVSNDAKNVFREDENPHQPGEFSGDLLKQAPSTEKGYIKTKHILQ